ncbi:hypothetical protein SDC9_179569 [bioreactor metagenome]|uniref:N-acetyltransferase domain-containing protein n=1 Tax=bioreactor metagenome TaxID=1076179 RepID=A0A645H8H9_9ZZZZ
MLWLFMIMMKKHITFGKSNDITLTCSIENSHGMHIYEKLGFIDTNQRDDDEIIMKLVI